MQERLLTLDPKYDQWREILRSNMNLRPALNQALGGQVRRDIRNQIVLQASDYTRHLMSLAREVGISLPASPHPQHPWTDSLPLIMSGHQPVVYHSGLLFKSQMLSRIAVDADAFGINLVIDTDEGDGGVVLWPKVVGGALELKRASLADHNTSTHTIYRAQYVASKEAVSELFAEIESDLRESRLDAVADRVSNVGVMYAALAHQPLAAAHAIVRRVLVRSSGCPEVLLSNVVTKTDLRGIIEAFLDDGLRLVETYNAGLNRYRSEHRIDNAANPFPNLKISADGFELPFWLIETTTRRPMSSIDCERRESENGEYIASRASMTTLLVRAYAADLFIHGIGGGSYDRFVDSFATDYLGIKLPRFVVASETRYLFPNEIAQISYELELVMQFKEMVSRTEKFLGRGIFDSEEEIRLREIISERGRLREQLKAAQTDDERRPAVHALNETNRKVRSCLEAGSMSAFLARNPQNRAALEQWKCREFPYFMFDN